MPVQKCIFPIFGNASQTSRFIFRTWKFYIEKLSILYKSRLRTQKTVRNLLDLGVEETGDVVALCFGSKAFLANADGGSARRRRRTSKTDAHVDVYGLVANERAPMDDEGRDCRSTPPTRLTDAHLWSRQTLCTEVSPRTGTGCKQAFERGTGRHGSQRHGSWMRRSGFACLWMHHSLWAHQSHTLCVCVQTLSVLKGGVEPPRPFGHTDLNRARLPIPPLERALSAAYSILAVERLSKSKRCEADDAPCAAPTSHNRRHLRRRRA